MQYGISRFYQQASFGSLNIIGDYCDQLLSFNYSSLSNNNETQRLLVAQEIDSLFTNNVTTMHGFNVSDFDNWSFPSTHCPKKHLSDNNIDLLVIVWRRNYLYRQESLTENEFILLDFLTIHLRPPVLLLARVSFHPFRRP